MNEPLTEQTLLLYCMKHYDGGFLATTEDFNDDLNRIKYIKKLITRYRKTGHRDDLKERLILNHIIILSNVFGAIATARILFYHLRDHFDIIKPFLVLTGSLPERFVNVHAIGSNIDTDLLPMDNNVIEALRQI